MSFTFISVSYYQTNNKDHIISWWGRHSSWRKNDCCEDLSFATDASRTARRRPRIRHFAQSIFRLEPIGVLHHRCSLWNFAVATVSIHFLPTTAADGMRLFNTRIQSKSFRSMIPFPIDIYIFMIFVFSLHCNERLNLLLNLFARALSIHKDPYQAQKAMYIV